MHDIFEGVAHGLRKKIITIDLLNQRKNIFNNRPTMTGNQAENITVNTTMIESSKFPRQKKFFLWLLKIIDTGSNSDQNNIYLKNLVAKTDRLTLKFHNMLHYDTLMWLYGPLNNFSSIRLEGKH
jgi:hypothetical protein